MPKKSPRYRAAQAYFRGVLANERRIQYLEAEIEQQQSRLALNGVEGGEAVSRTMEGDALERGYARLYELCDSLDTELIGYVDERMQAREVLDHIADSKAYEVLHLRYLNGYRFSDIQRMLYMSETTMFRIHEEALIKLYSYLPAEFRQKTGVNGSK